MLLMQWILYICLRTKNKRQHFRLSQYSKQCLYNQYKYIHDILLLIAIIYYIPPEFFWVIPSSVIVSYLCWTASLIIPLLYNISSVCFSFRYLLAYYTMHSSKFYFSVECEFITATKNLSFNKCVASSF